MDSGTLDRVEAERLFRIVRNLLGEGADCAIYAKSGARLAGSAGRMSATFGSLTPAWEWRLAAEVPRRVREARLEGDRLLLAATIRDFAGSEVGQFVVALTCAAERRAAALVQFMDSMTSIIETQTQLEAELDAMATELTGRYEELNLLYHSDDEVHTLDRDGAALQSLVDHCIDHLHVTMVALSLPRHQQLVFALNGDGKLHDPRTLMIGVQKRVADFIAAHPEGVILNSASDPVWRALGVDIPYKVMCVPVAGSRTQPLGFILCLRGLEGSDFFNSDRNLLKVVSRKAGKIVQSMYDELTGVYNRRAFEAVVERALDIARGRGVSHCLLNTNVDQLKVTNDAHGREAGDFVIQRVALLLRSGLREADRIGYLGDGKYGVLIENCTPEAGANVAEKLRALVSDANLEWEGRSLTSTVTMGVARIDATTDSIDDALEAAEIALDSARQRGRNQIRVFSQDDDYLIARRAEMQWANTMQKALRENQFLVYFQPIHPVVDDHQRYHFETLIRLAGDDGEVINPGVFLPAAETFSLMPLIDRWVIDATLKELSSFGYARRAHEGTIAINLSGQTLANPELAPYIGAKLREYGLDPTCICFEITETAAFGDFQKALAVCNEIKALGCRLSLDDFGTGLSSFSYLQKLPVDYVKIDGSFVRVMLKDDVSHAMVMAINHISHVMGLKTIAEFVENDVVRAELELMGIDYVQGFAYAKPLPILDALRALEGGTGSQDWLRGPRAGAAG